MKNIAATLGTLGLLATTLVAPMTANASTRDRQDHRQSTRNTGLDVSIGSVVLGLLGLAGHNETVAYVDGGRAQYSGYRSDDGRQGQDRIGNYAQRRDDQSNQGDQSNRNGRGNQNR